MRCAIALAGVVVAAACSTVEADPGQSSADTDQPPSSSASIAATSATDAPVEEHYLGGEWGRSPTALGGSELVPLLVPFDDRLFILYTQNGGREIAGEIYDPASGTTDLLADSGHVWRYKPAVAWTGTELLVIGGSSGPAIDDLVLAYDPNINEWRTLKEPPGQVDAWENSIGGPGAWTGEELLLWQDGLAFNPKTETWRTMARYPGPSRSFPAAVLTGDEIIVWGGCDASIPQCDDKGEGLLQDGVIYSIEADAWRAMSPAPLAAGVHPVAAVAEDAVLFYAGDTTTNPSAVQAARYDPATEEWTVIGAPPIEPRRYAAAAWTGQHFVIWGGDMAGETNGDGAAFDPDLDTWKLLPEPPPRSERDRHAMTWTGDHLYIVGGWASSGPITFTPR